MNKSIIFLITILIISTTLGSATALVIPVDFSTSDNVKLYTKTQTIPCEPDSNEPGGDRDCGFNNEQLFCDEGDSIINGFFRFTSGRIGSLNPNGDNHGINVNGIDGWVFGAEFGTNDPQGTQVFDLVIVCGKIIPMMTVGGIEIPTDTTSLLLAYSLLNMYWIAPTAVGIGLGVYLVKRRF